MVFKCSEKLEMGTEIPRLNEDVFGKILDRTVQRQQDAISKLKVEMNITQPKSCPARVKWPTLLQTNSQKLVYHDLFAKTTMLNGSTLHVIEVHEAQCLLRENWDLIKYVGHFTV